jgi:excinuclease ABC subunit C
MCFNISVNTEKIKIIKEKDFEKLPKNSGVYFFYDKKNLIYIGKAINIKNRVKNHFQQPSYRDKFFIEKVNKIGFIETNSEITALILEANLIKKHQPKFNIVWRDDKNYFYVAIVKNAKKIPYIYITHQKTENTEYIGPFVEGNSLKKTLKFLRRVFPYYTAKIHPKNKCNYCHLDLCPGPNPDLKLYKNNIKKLKLILQGKSNSVLNSLKKEMKILSKNENFEEAGKVRDKIFALEKIMAHTNVIEQKENQKTDNWENTQKILQGITNQPKKISRIECYDISNIQGNQATGSMIVFIDGVADKSQYKKFKIRLPEKPNDIAMLEEIITRRLTHTEWDYPEIMLIDGGIAQLNIAIKVKDLNIKTRPIKIISIAKKYKELFIEGRKDPILLKILPREIYNLVLQLDDEAHRFAITYHKKLRKQNLLK